MRAYADFLFDNHRVLRIPLHHSIICAQVFLMPEDGPQCAYLTTSGELYLSPVTHLTTPEGQPNPLAFRHLPLDQPLSDFRVIESSLFAISQGHLLCYQIQRHNGTLRLYQTKKLAGFSQLDLDLNDVHFVAVADVGTTFLITSSLFTKDTKLPLTFPRMVPRTSYFVCAWEGKVAQLRDFTRDLNVVREFGGVDDARITFLHHSSSQPICLVGHSDGRLRTYTYHLSDARTPRRILHFQGGIVRVAWSPANPDHCYFLGSFLDIWKTSVLTNDSPKTTFLFPFPDDSADLLVLNFQVLATTSSEIVYLLLTDSTRRILEFRTFSPNQI
jgi:hypothetical protein